MLNNKKSIEGTFLVYLLFSLALFSTINTIKVTKIQTTTESKTGITMTTTGAKVDGAKLAGSCMKALMDSIPPEFCWKKGADWGTIPTGCPSGYFRSLALCYEYCAKGYRHVLGVCWADCDGGYSDHGLTCFKNIFRWYFKHSYIPGSLTNFSSRIPCPGGMYRFGALCYRDCNNIGMANCGIGACAADGSSCGASIASMVVDVLSGLADAVALVVSFGASSAVAVAKNTLKAGLKKAGKAALNAVLKNVRKALTGIFKDKLLAKAVASVKNLAKGTLKDMVKDKLTENALVAMCGAIWNTATTKIRSASDIINEEALVSAVDIFNVKGILTDCGDVSDSNKAVACAGAVMGGLSTFDPTGLLTIAGAFMKPSCDVTTAVITLSEEDKKTISAVQALETVKDNCIILYADCNYQGRSKEYCSDTWFFTDFNDIASSMKSGKNASGLLFQHANYQGKQLPFGPSTTISCFADYKSEELKLNDLTSSVKFGADKCLIINYRTGKEQYSDFSSNVILCTTANNVKYDIPSSLEYVMAKLYRKGVKVTLYSGANFTGNSFVITASGDFTSNPAFIKSIRSVRFG